MDRIMVIDGFSEADAYSQSLRSAGFVVVSSHRDAALSLVQREPVAAIVAPAAALADRELRAIRKLHAELPIISIGHLTAIDRALLILSQPVVGAVVVAFITYMLQQTRSHSARRAPALEREISATDAKNEFASILDTAVSRGPVGIQKHSKAHAVLLGWSDYEKLTAAPSHLDVLRAEYDVQLARMQQPGMRERMQAAFDADSDELAAAATSYARRGG